jgi:hypothetical protein
MILTKPRNLFVFAILLAVWHAAGVGCRSPQEIAYWQERAREGTNRILKQQSVIDRLELDLDGMADDDPQRPVKEAELVAERDKLARLEEWREDSQRNLDRENKKPPGDPRNIVIPPGTPYADLIGLFAAGAFAAWGAWEKFNSNRRKRANEQIIQSIDRAIPVKTKEQKLVMDAVQDESTRKIVAEIRAQDPVPPAVIVPPEK